MATEVSLQGLLEKRRICRMRFTKAHKSVSKLFEQTQQLRADGAPADEIALSIGATNLDMQNLNRVFGDLQEVQDSIEFNPDNVDRLEKMEEEAREKEDNSEQSIRDLFLTLSARVQGLEMKVFTRSGASSRRGSEASQVSHNSDKSERNISGKQLTESFTEAFKSINTGLTSDQLSQIVTTMTKRKRDIKVPNFKGDAELFDQWKDLVQAELEKPGYSEAEKSHFVISVLEGDALKLALSLKNPSYEELLHVLENKYGDVLVRVQEVILEIANINPAFTANVKELDALYSKLVTCWNYILRKTENDESFINSSWILTALVRPKLPKVLVRRWDGERIKDERTERRGKTNLPIKFDELIQQLKEALQVARRTDVEAKTDHNRTKKKETYYRYDKHKPSGHALNITTNIANTKENKYNCVFCGRNHASSRCYTVKQMTIPQRTEKVKASNACFNCLRTNHFVSNCNASPCSKCGRQHNILLYIDKRQNRNEYPHRESTRSRRNSREMTDVHERREKIESTAGLVKAINGPKDIFMQSGIVEVESNVCVTQARVLFDSGSGVSFISKEMAKKLGLKGRTVEGNFTLAGGKTMQLKTQEVRFYLSSALPNWRGEVFEIMAYVIDKPSADLMEVQVDLSKMPYLQNLQLADIYPRRTKEEVDIMLGIEDTQNIQMAERIHGPRGMPIAQKTHIGWVLSGPCTIVASSDKTPQVNRVSFEIESPEDIAVKHWELDYMGILPTEKRESKPLEKEANRQYEDKTSFLGSQYETGLIRHPEWKNKTFRSNRQQALSRFKSHEKRLKQNPELAKMYDDQLQELIASGRAEKVEKRKIQRKTTFGICNIIQ